MALAIVAEGNAACKIAYCRVCLDVFKRSEGRGRPRKRCEVCEKTGQRPPRKNVYRYRPNRLNKPLSKQFECKNCHTWFHPKGADRTQFCGRQCAKDHRKWFGTERRKARLPHSKVFFVHCGWCSTLFVSQRDGRKYCSAKCSHEKTLRYLYERGVAGKGIKQVNCKMCGIEFAIAYGDKRRSFCSRRCLHKASRMVMKPKERARKRAAHVETVDPFKVFDRDGWRCQICHRPTPRRLRGTTDERAPELDHIVPLARGGEHSYRNTQCACRKCNGAKGATTYGQLPLLAL